MITDQRRGRGRPAPGRRLREWKTAARASGADAFPGSGRQPPVEGENRRLRADVKRLEMARDVPKKRRSSPPGRRDLRPGRGAPVRVPVAVMCRAPGVSRSGFYARAERAPGAAAVRRETLATHVREVHAEAEGRDGGPRPAAESNERGVACRVGAAATVLTARGIRAESAKRFVRTTDSNHRLPVAASVLGRDPSPARPSAARGTDGTDVPAREGRPFPALVADLLPRRIAGRATAAAATSRPVVDALDPAVRRRGVTADPVARSDRGSRSAGGRYRPELRRHGVVGGTSGAGRCRDNAVVESTFGSPTRDLVRRETYATRDGARASVFEYVEVFCDRVRRHSTPGYVSPAEYERTHDPELR